MATGKEIAEKLHEMVDRDMTFMHICGTHEAAIARTGLRSLLPEQLKIVMGPGCPVCITPQGEIDAALDLAGRDCIITTYGDLLHVPGSRGSLESCGGDVRIVQGIHKAVEVAKKTDKEVVFISVGFETTAPTVAAMLLTKPPENFSILSCHRIVPPAMKWLLEQGEAKLNGFMLPGHVCTVMGYEEYEAFPVPQVDEDHAAMISSTMGPSHEDHFFIYILGANRPAIMGSFPVSDKFCQSRYLTFLIE